MHMVTFMYWYRSQKVGGEVIDIVVGECSRCGLRVSAQCPDSAGRERCAEKFRARCRRAEENHYVSSILEAMVDA